jgi:hypothetical protein
MTDDAAQPSAVRADGAEVLREPAGDPLLTAGDVLAGIRRDLATLDPDTFLAQWRSRAKR